MSKNTENFDIYQMVTDQIIEILETHEKLNYQSTWTPINGEILAFNPVSKTVYRGFNQIYLCYVTQKQKFTQNRWITIHQGNELGASVIKGEKSRPVTYWSWLYIDEKTGKNITKKVKEILKAGHKLPDGIKKIPLLRYYNVFNICQFENLPEKLFFQGETLEFTEPQKDETAEEFIINTGAKIEYIQDAGNSYSPLQDLITLCERKQFEGKESFYKTAFHELGHWTGHSTRLNRPLGNLFGSKEYAKEELVAELFSAFISARCGFSSQITNNAAYIQSWLTSLRNDKKFIFHASGEAQKAADFASELVALKIGQSSGFIEVEIEAGEI